ncbi:MAG: hypothetical protein ABSD27_10335 [Bryobacteraceae bacterium]|jgi:hypothetical protein
MVPELLIALLVLILTAYWFRYKCLVILRATAARDRARQVAAANHLSFAEIAARLEGDVPAEELRRFHAALLRDYTVLTCLLRYSSAVPAGSYSVEERMLMLDFKLMHLWFTLVRGLARGPARRSLAERTRILFHFGNRMAERSAVLSKA